MANTGEIHVVFVTDRFNCSQPMSHYINACCYGDDLAAWLAQKLLPRGYDVDEPGQEDWGWYLQVANGERRWFVAIGVTQPNEAFLTPPSLSTAAPRGNLGEWRIIIKTRGSLWQRLTHKNQISPSDELVQAVNEIVTSGLQVSAKIENGGAL
ncbi:MAG TPA: hypothetical protein VGN12_30725 [Pirellulales bacterium]|jgi:hypothetical protein